MGCSQEDGRGAVERPQEEGGCGVLTIVVVFLKVLDHERDGILRLVDQELLQHVLWAQGGHTGG